MFIEDFNEKIENDFYQENTIILMENMYWCREEVGYQFNENKLVKINNEDRINMVKEISSYGNLLIIEDKFNLCKNYASITKFKCDNNVLGLSLSNNI